MDRRSGKTKKLLEDALIKLMIEKGFDKISIKDLTEEADINRGTFYLHYKDKYDLLEQKEDEFLKEFAKLAESISEKYPRDFKLLSKKENLLQVFNFVYTYIKQNSDFMKVLLGANGDLNFQMKLKNFIESMLIKNVEVEFVGEIKLKYIGAVAASAQLGIIQKWLRTGMEESPEELAVFVSDVVYTIYNGVLKANVDIK
ncbi:TetR/AcrR family transcriptional regulator [Clostridium sp. YIM B02551]|uniref:TetR/AcrR family transcriptional regulator n=1 Tax=Clostridium sp. YIM B02551 TaxID=2910679 RepID=UPI001EEC4CB8|nr:TetR/AcrR family transcriptional regulator C-terminal domain-containing protein [Clostridium sp. YIM B02551]